MSDVSAVDPCDPVAVAQALVRCPSVNGDCAAVMTLMDGLCRGIGLRTRLMETRHPVSNQTVHGMYAWVGEGERLLFTGHLDVVPVGDESTWERSPFGGEVVRRGEIGEVLEGRGAADMKGAMAAAFSALARVQRNPNPSPALGFLVAGDEELPGAVSTRFVAKTMADEGERWGFCVNVEPTGRRVFGDTIKVGRRGSLSGTLTVLGVQGHTAYPHLADNACHHAADLIRLLTTPDTLDKGAEHFQPSSVQVVSVNTGNRADNVIPDRVEVRFNVRFAPLHTPASVARLLETRLSGGAHKRWTLTIDPHPAESYLTQPKEEAELLRRVVYETVGVEPEFTTNGGTSDSRFLHPYCPVVDFGPVGDSMHQTNEFVRTADVNALCDVLENLIDAWGR